MKELLQSRRWILGLCVIVQFAVPLGMIQGRERVLSQGEVFRFITQPIDPIDPFQGRYVSLRIDRDFIPGTETELQELDRRQPVFARIATDADGFAYFSSWTLERPKQGAYLQTRITGISRTWQDQEPIRRGMSIEVPFTRFYMDELKAPAAERQVAVASRNEQCWVQVRVLEGSALIENVFVNGVEIAAWVERHQSASTRR